MITHPNRYEPRVEVTAAGQGHSLVYINGRLAAGISTNAAGRWIMYRVAREAGETCVVGDEQIDVSCIYHHAKDLNRAARLFTADPAGVAAAWPKSSLRAQCRDVLDRLSQ